MFPYYCLVQLGCIQSNSLAAGLLGTRVRVLKIAVVSGWGCFGQQPNDTDNSTQHTKNERTTATTTTNCSPSLKQSVVDGDCARTNLLPRRRRLGSRRTTVASTLTTWRGSNSESHFWMGDWHSPPTTRSTQRMCCWPMSTERRCLLANRHLRQDGTRSRIGQEVSRPSRGNGRLRRRKRLSCDIDAAVHTSKSQVPAV